MEDRDAARGVDRVVEAMDDVAVDRVGIEVAKVLSEGLPGDGQGIAVEQPSSSIAFITTGMPP